MVASEVVNDSVAARGPDGVVAMEGDAARSRPKETVIYI